MIRNGILHVKTVPKHPSSNGLAERSVHVFREGMKKLEGFGATVHTTLSRFCDIKCNKFTFHSLVSHNVYHVTKHME